MNKKQRNRKIVTQNKRNRIINKRYVSTIRTLSKLFKLKIQVDKTEINEKDKFKVDLLNIVKNSHKPVLEFNSTSDFENYYNFYDEITNEELAHVV